MNTDQTRALIQQFLDARAANDATALSQLLADDATWVMPPSADTEAITGRDDVVHALTGGVAGAVLDLSTLRRDVRTVLVDGNRAAVQQRLTARALNGNRYANEYCWIFTCDDGLVRNLEEYTDSLYASRVLSPR